MVCDISSLVIHVYTCSYSKFFIEKNSGGIFIEQQQFCKGRQTIVTLNKTTLRRHSALAGGSQYWSKPLKPRVEHTACDVRPIFSGSSLCRLE